ncbi:MAG: hypothetical protein QW695_01035 [Candidatus Bathyarchaeia archaeon]
MPQRIICKSCGHILYESVEFVYPGEVIDSYGGVCPSCGSRILFNADDARIELKPAQKHRTS